MWLGVVALSEAILRWVELRSLLLHSSGEGLSENCVSEFELKSRVRLGGPIAILARNRVVVLLEREMPIPALDPLRVTKRRMR